MTKEEVSMIQMVGRIKNRLSNSYQEHISKVLAQCKSELIVRMATIATMNMNTVVSKATNTTNSCFDDLRSNNKESMSW